ncbi:histidinol-phosphate transaminase [Helicobacter saguini]|uniref:Histidinol-phosphate aminotransferase n=1 Tax=Helicobacter saguini TaxID=1548018 RepID=A0A347VT65_9HELI|nr:histidinol-phosphate transaminase [Helicobacter saguini]MWV62221.1 histidinol-phosphate transaminase [Helicobacter saguini]MWV67106.1 histidinol-phosphate transaminase [Helicobacter saguini]MWV69456.1 histidinol-phosphate transaminase [Helicobacter saguini]MWV70991.1 histidinol-phosphate transaminase [Helicobacter saguini]TLD92925.1 histidinol-phosphate transaminase [Helicobacter saguini]
MNFHKYVENLPTYEAGKPLELLMREFNIAPCDIIKLGSNENPFGVSPSALNAIKENAHLASVYPDDSYFELKNALSKTYNIESKNIIIGSGSDQIIEFCLHSICDSHKSVLMAKTTFAMYEIYAKHFNAKILRTSDFYHNLDSMYNMYREHKPSVIFLCTPNNPLGEALLKDDVIKFIEKIDSETLIVLDCAYMEYCAYKSKKHEIKPSDIVKYPNVIYLGTFSKAYGLGGMRVGYGIANPSIISTLHKLRPPFNITTLSLKAATASLNDSDFINKSVENNVKEMTKYKAFAESNLLEMLESYANFVTFLLNNKLNSTKISFLLLQKGIVIRDLSSYGLNAFRITIGTPKQNDILLEKLGQILKDLS